MIKLAITGSIASGKSVAESYLKQKRIPSIDADMIVHRLLSEDKEVIEKICLLFNTDKNGILDENGKISRKKLGKIVFNDKDKLKQLEEIIHPKVKEEINRFFEENKNRPIAAAVVPVLYEAGMQNLFDYVVLVSTKKELQIKRLMERDSLTRDQAEKRINLFIDEEEKIKKADFVVYNNLDINNTMLQIEKILKGMLNK